MDIDTLPLPGNALALKEKLKEFGIIKTLEEGDIIVPEHSHIRSIPIVLSGTIKVFRTDEEGREILLYYIESG